MWWGVALLLAGCGPQASDPSVPSPETMAAADQPPTAASAGTHSASATVSNSPDTPNSPGTPNQPSGLVDPLPEDEEIKADPALLEDFRSGEQLFRIGRSEPARRRIVSLLERRPSNPILLFSLGMIEQSQGRVAEAVERYSAALAARPGLVTAANNLAWLLATSPAPFRDPERALAVAQRMVDSIPAPRAEMLDTLAAAHAAAGERDSAILVAQRAIAEAESRNDHRKASTIVQRLGLYEAGQQLVLPPQTAPEPVAAAAALARFAQTAPQAPGGRLAMERLGWFLAAHPDPRVRDGELALALATAIADQADERAKPAALDLRSAALAERGQFDLAARFAQEAALRAKQAVDSGTASDDGLAGRLAARAAQYRAGQPLQDDRLPAFTPLGGVSATDRPRLAAAWQLLVEELLRENRPEPAIVALESWRQMAPTDVNLTRLLASLQFRVLGPQFAARALESLVDLAPEDARAWSDLGLAYQIQGQPWLASVVYREALRWDPEKRETANNLAWILATTPHDSIRDGAAALRWIEPVVDAEKGGRVSTLDTLAAAQAETGHFAEALGTLDVADRLLAKAVEEATPEARAALSRQAQGLALRRRWYEASRPFRDTSAGASSVSAEERTDHLTLGNERLMAGSLDEAVRHFQAALRPGGATDAETLLSLGLALAQQGHAAKAMKAFADSLRLQPGLRRAAESLIWMLATCGDERLRNTDDAVWLAEWIHENREQALGSTEETYEAAAAAYAAAERFEEAIAYANEASRLAERRSKPFIASQIQERIALYAEKMPYHMEPLATPPTEDELVSLYEALAALANDQGRMESAERWLKAAIGLRGEDGQLQLNLGQALRKQGRFQEAVAAFRASLQFQPEGFEAMSHLAWLLATRETVTPTDAAEAKALAKRVCENRETPAHLDCLAAATAAGGHFDAAVKVALRAVRLAEKEQMESLASEARERLAGYEKQVRFVDNPRAQLEFHPAYRASHLRLAQRLRQDGMLDQAEQHFRGVLRKNPDPDVLNALGEVLASRKQTAEAIRCFRKVLELRPEWPVVANNLAWMLATQPKPEQAVREALALAERVDAATGSAIPAYLSTFAVCQAAAGDFAKAERTAMRAAALAAKSGQTALEKVLLDRARIFAAGQPYRE